MKLTILFDHRFYRDTDGTIFSSSNHNYDLYADRYLQVFDEITLVARVTDRPAPSPRDGAHVEGAGVQVIDTGDWSNLRSLAVRIPKIRRQIGPFMGHDRAIIGIVPGRLALIGLFHGWRRRGATKVYGVEMIGDPEESFGPDAIRHPLRAQLASIWPALLRPVIRRATAIAYVSEYTLRRKYPPGGGAYVTNYSSINLPDDKVVSTPHSPPSGRRAQLVFIGSLNGLHKGPDTLIDAVSTCVSRGHDIGLRIVGSGYSQEALELRAAHLGERVQFLGQLHAGDPVLSILDQSDLFVLPTLSEGLPRSVIEAMARGLPVIASAVGGVPELLPEEDLISSTGNPDTLADKILEVLNDPSRLVIMAARNLGRSGDFRASVLMKRRLAFYVALKTATSEAALSSIALPS